MKNYKTETRRLQEQMHKPKMDKSKHRSNHRRMLDHQKAKPKRLRDYKKAKAETEFIKRSVRSSIQNKRHKNTHSSKA